MRETVSSLRRYFILVGVLGGLGTLVGIAPVLGALGNPALTGILWGLVALFGACGLFQGVVCLAFLYFASRLERLLRDNPGAICKTIKASMGVSVVALGIQLYLAGPASGNLLYFACGLGISFYLLRQVQRLSVEVREEKGPVSVA
jgi:hypothetical protein